MRASRRVWPDHNQDTPDEPGRAEWCPESGCLADGEEDWQVCPTCGQRLPMEESANRERSRA